MFMRRKIRCNYLSRMITRVRVAGMTCQHCIRAVFTSLTGVEGIVRADVSLGAVEVEHDGRVTVDQLREAIAVAGYEVQAATVDRRRLPLA
jgi:copper chaperone